MSWAEKLEVVWPGRREAEWTWGCALQAVGSPSEYMTRGWSSVLWGLGKQLPCRTQRDSREAEARPSIRYEGLKDAGGSKDRKKSQRWCIHMSVQAGVLCSWGGRGERRASPPCDLSVAIGEHSKSSKL